MYHRRTLNDILLRTLFDTVQNNASDVNVLEEREREREREREDLVE